MQQNAHTPFSLILSDQKMPEMNGTEFLTKAKKISPDAMRILLTGYSDIDAVINAINKSEIHRYFTKPWDNNDLIIQIRQMLEQYELIMENKRLQALTVKQNKELSEFNNNLEKKVKERSEEIIQKNKILTRLNEELESSLHNTVHAFSSVSEINAPHLTGHARRVCEFSRQIALNLALSETEVTHIEMAALLHDIGKIGFPEKLLKYKESIWTTEDKRLYQKHPEQGQSTVQFINRMEHVSILIRSHHENFDGTGFPDKLSGEEIPIGAKIIAVANAYDKILNLKIDTDDSIKKFAQNNQISYQQLLNDPVLLKKVAIKHVLENSFIKYDPDIIKVFVNIIAAKEDSNQQNKDSIELKENYKPGTRVVIQPYLIERESSLMKRTSSEGVSGK